MRKETSVSWFVTPRGRMFMMGTAGFTTVALFGLQFVPHTVGLNKYFDIVTMRRLGNPIPLTSNLEKLWNQVLSDIKISDYHRELLRPFMVFGYDSWHAGSLYSRFGALIGIPTNFVYEKVSSIDKDSIVVNDDPVDWTRKDAKELLNALILSDEAKKYAVAREIMMVNNRFIYYEAAANGILFFACYNTASRWNETRGLLEKPFSIRAFFYVCFAAFYWGIWAMQRDALTRHYEFAADKKLSELGPEYVRGGLEFYDKTLQRNTALRSLLGERGNKLYTAMGNDHSFFRQKHLPYTQRKYFFEDIVKQFHSTADKL
ncbi:transmembrane protein 177 isoform X1 [Cotesia glomerata]|uniref:Transmembrane protein 177 n=1 Tax=Cotesia glomerata TaxID=32391 RepID=A0AAV7I6M2_COTGL|nr:transmembrane protein 177 isoform X1 [Cotesia glomerata]KAH0546999.1 hypothetical protein KQX54_016631 [Cotesia glomerata]